MTMIADVTSGVGQDQSLSASLRECTAAAHENAEQSPFMARLMAGSLNAAAVADYTGQFWFIYRAMEEAVRENAGDSRLAAFVDPKLERLAAIEADLAVLIGPNWREELTAGPAAQRYVARLTQLAANGDALGLIAHHYTRYLGDLSGGQVISRRLQQHYGISEEGMNFYDFADIGKIKPYRDGYRARLDALDLDTGETDRLFAEANLTFELNGELFRELERKHCAAAG